MAYVYKRAEKWYIGFRDNRGRARRQACGAKNKTEAKRMADELGLNHERQRVGLDPLPASDGGGTFGALLRWWLKTYSIFPGVVGKNDLKAMEVVWQNAKELGLMQAYPSAESVIWKHAIRE